MEIFKKEIGSEAHVTGEITGGNIVITAKLDTAGVGATATAIISGDYFFDKLAEAIPGQIDDAVIALLKQAVKSI